MDLFLSNFLLIEAQFLVHKRDCSLDTKSKWKKKSRWYASVTAKGRQLKRCFLLRFCLEDPYQRLCFFFRDRGERDAIHSVYNKNNGYITISVSTKNKVCNNNTPKYIHTYI